MKEYPRDAVVTLAFDEDGVLSAYVAGVKIEPAIVEIIGNQAGKQNIVITMPRDCALPHWAFNEPLKGRPA